MSIIAIEKWKPVVGYETLYEVSDYGRVRSLSGYRGVNMWGAPCFIKGKILTPALNKKGYPHVRIKRKTFLVHRLLAIAFFPCTNYKNLQINHIDCDKSNNLIENLEWCDNDYNIAHAHENGRFDKIMGHGNMHSKLTTEDVIEIKKLLKAGILSGPKIAQKFNVRHGSIYGIKHNRYWKHLNKQ